MFHSAPPSSSTYLIHLPHHHLTLPKLWRPGNSSYSSPPLHTHTHTHTHTLGLHTGLAALSFGTVVVILLMCMCVCVSCVCVCACLSCVCVRVCSSAIWHGGGDLAHPHAGELLHDRNSEKSTLQRLRADTIFQKIMGGNDTSASAPGELPAQCHRRHLRPQLFVSPGHSLPNQQGEHVWV